MHAQVALLSSHASSAANVAVITQITDQQVFNVDNITIWRIRANNFVHRICGWSWRLQIKFFNSPNV